MSGDLLPLSSVATIFAGRMKEKNGGQGNTRVHPAGSCAEVFPAIDSRKSNEIGA